MTKKVIAFISIALCAAVTMALDPITINYTNSRKQAIGPISEEVVRLGSTVNFVLQYLNTDEFSTNTNDLAIKWPGVHLATIRVGNSSGSEVIRQFAASAGGPLIISFTNVVFTNLYVPAYIQTTIYSPTLADPTNEFTYPWMILRMAE